jgi:hypothetical protein
MNKEAVMTEQEQTYNGYITIHYSNFLPIDMQKFIE